jgi:ribonuclease VapC
MVVDTSAIVSSLTNEPEALAKLPTEVVAFDADQSVLARQAYRRFGKGIGHWAQLNLGDCAAYALARSLARPLLYKGGDFTETDIVSAMDMTKPMA